jgi:hypothetical protein
LSPTPTPQQQQQQQQQRMHNMSSFNTNQYATNNETTTTMTTTTQPINGSSSGEGSVVPKTPHRPNNGATTGHRHQNGKRQVLGI